jgi:Carboxypeptidase regulatory-like domain
MFAGVPVPGATVTATQGEKKFVAITDQQGAYSFPELADGPFTVQVEMLGFSTVKQEVNTPTAQLELKMLPMGEMKAEVVHAAPPEPAAAAPAATTAAAPNNSKAAPAQPRQQSGFQRTQVNASNAEGAPASNDTAAPQSSAFANLSQSDLSQRAADGLTINGTVNNGAASPFAQLAQFGNNRRNRPLYNGNINAVLDNSALDARSYSLTGQDTAKPTYNRFTGAFNIGGPLKIPGLIRLNSAPTFFFSYQRMQNRNANTLPGRMPTALERGGDFSQTLNPLGQHVQIIDPLTGTPFDRNVIPQDRISPQATTLLNLFPLPNFTPTAAYNYQIPLVDSQHQDALQGRLSKVISPKNQVVGSVDIQSNRSGNSSLFNFVDRTQTFSINTVGQWTTRPTQRFALTFRYVFSRQTTRITPYFANQLNISGIAGVTGNNQDAPNWGSPNLNFAGGTSSLTDAQYTYNRTENNTFSYNSFWNRGRHNVTFGADMRRYQFNVLSQQDARGTFTFTGGAVGSDFAGFLLGIPDTSSIAFGNADKYFRQQFYDGFITDDYRMNGSLTINAGLRWEYETPIDELRGRLVNLSVGPHFGSNDPIVGNNLVRSDALGIQPRISFAWRPVAASSLIVRGGYGIYRNTNVYQAIATQMAQQAPLSTSLLVQNTAANPLSLANGFVARPGATQTTFAVDPDFRVGYVQSWQLSAQRDLPAALQMTATYLGTKGTRLPQEFLPNTFPTGAVSPSGYVYLSSNGDSTRNALQLQLRRRLRSGFTASTQYTFSKAFDNAPLMAGGIVTANQGGTSIAQNWLDLAAERAPSSFDQRHQVTVQTQYTTGVGLGGGGLAAGWKGALFREWTLAGQLTVGSGLPQTPIYLAPVPGTGVTGVLRPSVTGVPVNNAPDGLFLNSAAFQLPAAGQWGNAGRNSITGPSQFLLNATLGRSFQYRDRYTIDLRVDAANILNHVTYKSWNTILTTTRDPLMGNLLTPSAQFGHPSSVNGMRTMQTTLRLRF